MNRGCVALISMFVLSSTLASCGPGDGPTLYPVHGKVIYKGEPAVGANVLFQREDDSKASPDSNPIVPSGSADESGAFTLQCDALGQGAPAGKYRVLIQWRNRVGGPPVADAGTPSGSAKKTGRPKPKPDKPDGAPDRLEGRFMRPDTARFHVEVKPGDNELTPFDVSN